MNSDDLAYIAGVLAGDAYIDNEHKNPVISLMTVNQKFAEFFKEKLRKCGLSPYINERDRHRKWIRNGKIYSFDTHYHITHATCKPDFLALIPKRSEIISQSTMQAYLAGFFHSEGHFHAIKYPRRICYSIEITNKKKHKLQFIQHILAKFNVQSKIYPKSIKSGLGWRLMVQDREGYQKVIQLTGGKV